MKSPVRETQGSALMRQAGAACRNLTTQVLGGGGQGVVQIQTLTGC